MRRRQHGVCDSGSQRLCQGIRVLKGGWRLEQLIIYMLMGRHYILYSVRCLDPVCVFPYMFLCVCVCAIKDERRGKKEGVLENDMYGSDSHLFRGSFQTVETMLLHFATITPV